MSYDFRVFGLGSLFQVRVEALSLFLLEHLLVLISQLLESVCLVDSLSGLETWIL